MGGSLRLDFREGTGALLEDFMQVAYYHNFEFGINVTFVFLSNRMNGAFPIGTQPRFVEDRRDYFLNEHCQRQHVLLPGICIFVVKR